MTPTKGEHAQPEAPYLQLADLLASGQHLVSVERKEAADAIRTLHAKVAALTAAPQGGAYAELPVDELRTNYLDLLQEVLDAKDVMLAAGCKQGTFAVMFAEYRASHGQAPAGAAIYVSAHECQNCGHIGINDAQPTNSACYSCEWSGPSPDEDLCPGCGKKWVMAPACPKCDGLYVQLIEGRIEAPTAQPAPAATPQAEPLHITHGPLMRHAAALLRSRKPVLPDHESVAAELEMAADGHPTPAGDPSPEWLEVGRIAMEQAPQADSQPAPVLDYPHARRFGGCPSCGRADCVAMACTRVTPDELLRIAARAPADSVTAPAAYSGNLEQELAMLIRRIVSSARRNCEDGSNVLKLANEAWSYLVRKGLNGSPLRDAGVESDNTPPTQAADSVLEDAALLDWLDQNIFHREMSEWDAKFGGRCNQNMWVLFAPKGVQGSARKIIDAARKQGANHD